MKLLALAISLIPAIASAITVSYDNNYDNGALSINAVACSNGQNGLGTKGYATLGALPTFPRIGGAFSIAGWNSPNCGKCYSLTYNGRTVNITAVDHTDAGFNIAQAALDQLTNGHAVEWGRVDANYTLIASSYCGL